MRRRLSLIGATVVALFLSLAVSAPPASAATGLHIQDGKLYEANGNEFVMRGVNHAHTWYRGETGSFADIKALGANTVRVVLSSGDRWTRNDAADVANVVALCKENRLICVLEVHDTTGYGEQSGAASLDQAVDYWLSVQDALQGQEQYVIVNIGNEPYGNTNYEAWTPDTIEAIQRLRDAGFEHTLMVDAPNWGQDWSFTMRDNAAEVFASDPHRNTMFSVHMYGVFDTEAEITDYLTRFVDAGLPITVGEFGHNHSDGDPDEDAIFARTRSLGVGFLGWSWSGNSGGVDYLDMATNFDAGNLTPWGQRIFHGPNGIGETAEQASVYGSDDGGNDGGGDGGGGDDPGGTADCAVDYQVVNQWSSGFQADVVVHNTGTTAIDGWNLQWAFADGQTVTQMWNARVSQSAAQVSATSEPYTAAITAGGSVRIGFNGTWNGSNSNPSAFTLDGASCAVS